ncbi:hypothetical protein CS033_03373 [Phocaeicola vulgatus]|nr:hypothetical protein [Phocaeicola vulgatus]MCO5806588.1 hypothetical protein [Phocaeicola vulgatus]
MTEKHSLPLTNITQIVIVQQNNLYRRFLLHDSSQFLNIHLQTAITHKYAYSTIRATESSAYSSGKTESHCSQSTRSYNAAVLTVFKITSSHHLVLSHICHQYGLIIRSLTHRTHHFTHIQCPVNRMNFFTDNMFIFRLFIFSKAINPFGMFILPDKLRQHS